MRSGTPRNFVRPASGHAPPVRALCGLIRSRREAGEPGLPRNSHGGKFLSGASGASGRTCAPQEFPPAQCAPFAFFGSGASGRGHVLGRELAHLPGHAPPCAPELHVPRSGHAPPVRALCGLLRSRREGENRDCPGTLTAESFRAGQVGHRGEPVRPKSFRPHNAPRSLFSEVGHRGTAMLWGGSLPTMPGHAPRYAPEVRAPRFRPCPTRSRPVRPPAEPQG